MSTSNERLDIIQGEVQKLERREEESGSLAQENKNQIEELESKREEWGEELEGLREIHSQVSEEQKELDEQRMEFVEERATLRANLE